MNTPAPAATDAAPVRRPDDPTVWATLAPLLVIEKSRKKSGRPRHADRPIFNGLIWLARTGSQWSQLPRVFGATSIVHARFQEWVAAGCFERAWAELLRRYDDTVGGDWEWHAADGCLIRSPGGKKGRLVRLKRPAPTPPTGANPASNATC